MSFYKSHAIHAKSLSIFIAAIIAFNPFPPVQASEDNLFFDMPVVLSASRLEQPVSETPMAVSSIDRQIIEASGARTIPEILRLVPGIVVGNSVNEWGKEAKLVVAYHGHTDQYSKQMQVLIDGRSIYEPLLGGVDWNMQPINIEDIERIEVSRGPNASTFGSNSFLAVINIITRHASEDPGHYAKLRAGNHNIADLTYRYGGNSGKLDYRVTLSTLNDDGQDAKKNISAYDGSNNNLTYEYSDETVENYDDLNTGAVDYRLDYQIDNRKQLSYQGGYGKTAIETNKNFEGYKSRSDSYTTNMHQFIKLENTPDNKNSFVIQYYYNLQTKTNQSWSEDIPYDTPPFKLFMDFGFKSERHNLELTHYNQTTDELRLIWGVSAQQDIAESPHWLTDQGTIRKETYRLFANAEWQLDQHNLLNFGALIEENKTPGYEISPRLSLIHKFNEQHSIRIGVSRAVRSPFISEEFGNTVFRHIQVSDDLAPYGLPSGSELVDQVLAPPVSTLDYETIISREIGYYGHFFDNALLFNARIFQDDLDDLIHTVREDTITDTVPGDGGTDVHENASSSDISGIELEFNLHASQSLRIIGSAAYMKIESRGVAAEEYENSAPEKAASLLAIKEFNEKYSGSLGFYYTGSMHFLDAPGTLLENQQVIDLRISKADRQSGYTSKLSLVLKNLLGEYSNYNNRPRHGPLIEQNMTGYIEYSISFQ